MQMKAACMTKEDPGAWNTFANWFLIKYKSDPRVPGQLHGAMKRRICEILYTSTRITPLEVGQGHG